MAAMPNQGRSEERGALREAMDSGDSESLAPLREVLRGVKDEVDDDLQRM